MATSQTESSNFISGMEQKWTDFDENHSKLNQNNLQVLKIEPQKGNAGTVITVVLSNLIIGPYLPKLAFHALVVETRLFQTKDRITLVATVPAFHHIQSTSNVVPLQICLVDDTNIIHSWKILDFIYDQHQNNNNNNNNTNTNNNNKLNENDYHIQHQVKLENLNDFDHTNTQPTVNMPTSSITSNNMTSVPPAHPTQQIPSFFDDPFDQPSITDYNPFPSQNTFKYDTLQSRQLSINEAEYNAIQTTTPAFANVLTANFDPTPQFTFTRNNNSSNSLFNSNMITTGAVNTLNPIPDIVPTNTNTNTTASTTATATATTGVHNSNLMNKQSSHTTHSKPHHTTHTRAHSYSSYKTGANIPTTSVDNYQPYPGLISRANLVIIGDLETMLSNWQPDEINQKRRLVQFHRSHIGQDIQCSFKPISSGEYMANINAINNCNNQHHLHSDMDPSTTTSTFNEKEMDHSHHPRRDSNDSASVLHDDHPMTQLKLYQQQNPHDTIVSCIYWSERDDFFITSVDCIHLLEKLMNVQFSVEEKNRVRRNLEGFRPLTVSKCKAESADFFKLIMSFPHPKPRNIEKDVKVFPWKTLPYALKKIITKYTASTYSSTHDTSSIASSSSTSSIPTTARNRYSSPAVFSQQQQQPYQRRSSYNSN
ncbi:unnamed protein product [Cunninghamella blakesleeana]